MGQVHSSSVYNHPFFSGWSQAQKDEFLLRPALAPPANTIPDFEHPPNRTHHGIVITTVFLSLAGMCFLVRAYSRIMILRRVKTEDVIGLAAMGFYAGLIWTAYSLAHTPGFWIHQWNVTVLDMSPTLYYWYILPAMYTMTMVCCKSAILLEWIHLFVPPGTRNGFFWICSGMLWTTVGFYIVMLIAGQFYCTPREKIWHRWVPGTCGDRRDLQTPSAFFNVITDFIILLLPQKVIWNLDVSNKKRIGVSIIFSIGLLACVCAIGRTITNMRLDYEGDVTYESSDPFFWGLAECTGALVVFCMHSFPLVFSKIPALHILASNLVKSFKARDSAGSSHTKSKSSEDISLRDYKRIEEGRAERRDSEVQLDKPEGQPVAGGGIRVTTTFKIT
ncbi:hypothetical protein B0I35DRAFT_362170 [Stachybotrys elegans]|uniref:Rhodopsin domain-containing protein n=1 Tax=Stachybotrys elegans TaxID=80388 RepID=A0A8K0SEL2_9HYPO|nr:hypothetical protein B0I35DRAFT_362170 [Stachybotrys elegans]